MPPKPAAARYRAGQAPKGYKGDVSDSDEDEQVEPQKAPAREKAPEPSRAERESERAPGPAPNADDRRLQRLMRAQQLSDEEDGGRRGRGRRTAPSDCDEDEPRSRGRRPPAEENEVEGEENEAETERRRELLRQRAIQQRREEEERLAAAEAEAAKEGSGSEDEEESSEYTTDSEEDDLPKPVLLRPVFIPKSQRDTIAEKERLEREAEEEHQRQLAQLEERKKESHFLVADEIKRSMAKANAANEVPDVDDTDGLNEEEEYAAWKLRELLRLKRDKEEREAEEAEIAEIERRRNMTDAEREAEDARLRELEPQKDRGKQKFLQKYYHKGAFYQDLDILQRDYSSATGEDTINKELLPEVMQVKNFGKKGRTKWTHLAAEDTSTKESPWFQKSSDINKRTLEKYGGMHGGFNKPTKRRKV